MSSSRIDIIGLSREELAENLVDSGVEPSLVKPLWNWIYVRGATDFLKMASISRKWQSRLANVFVIGRPEVVRELVSDDGTRKWLLQFPDIHRVETVLIPANEFGALCVSSQVGCSLIERVGQELGVNLAISLHAVRDDLRDVLVPLNKKYPIQELIQACRDYPAASNARRITFEYVMLKGVNDSDADARELVHLLRGIHAKVNLIPWNPWPNAGYESSTHQRIQAFARIVNDAGFSSAVRASRGVDIMAACGQLKSESMDVVVESI